MIAIGLKRLYKERIMLELLYKDEVYTIVGAAIEVHRELGAGFLEGVYQEALEIELVSRQVPFATQMPLGIVYKSHHLQKGYVADLCCYGKIIVELKALDQLSGREEAQLLNYLKATGLRVGLLINFGARGKLEWKRFAR
jgi:GxxExxY protein